MALLESFSSQVFAGRGTHGWGRSWEADAHLILQWAQLQPRIVYDETVLAGGLDDIRVLVMPGCDVLTEGVLKRITEFQDKGGLIVADENVCPAIMPDILLPSYKRTGKPDEDKAALQELAAGLRRELDDFYPRHADSSDPEVVVRCRRQEATDYLFAVNDRRTFGDYVGHHGIVMEKGLPSSATLSINHPGGNVYDLMRHEAVRTEDRGDGVSFDADFGPGAGTVYMVADQAIDRVLVTGPKRVKRGGRAKLSVRVVDGDGDAVKAVIPLQVEIADAEGRAAECSGYYGAENGQLSLNLDIASNDAVGQWTVVATELASGRSAEHRIMVVR